MAAHAKLGASSTSRWMTCPGSVRMSEGLPNTSSTHARLGSAAHSLGEICLLNGDLPMEYLDAPHPDPEYMDLDVDVNMVDAVAVYVDHIRSYKIPIDKTNVERRVRLARLGDWAKDLFGTADFLAVDRQVLLVDDYKHGEGMMVEVEDNTQFMYYGLGGLLSLKDPHAVAQVRTTAIQPRKEHEKGPIRSCTYSVQELLDWGQNVLKPAVLATREPDAPLVPSDKACVFCPAKGICPALADKAMSDAMLDFDDTGAVVPTVSKDKLTPAQVAAILKAEKFVVKWFAGVAELALAGLSHGKDITGGEFKLVAGRSSRDWKDTDAAEKKLLDLGYTRADLYAENFTTPAKAETLVGKQQKSELADLISTTEGKPTIAPASDKRPAILRGPEDDFVDDVSS